MGMLVVLLRWKFSLENEINLSIPHPTFQAKTPREFKQCKKKKDLEEKLVYSAKAAIMRTKIRWHNDGENNTKYFLQMEKIHSKRL